MEMAMGKWARKDWESQRTGSGEDRSPWLDGKRMKLKNRKSYSSSRDYHGGQSLKAWP